MPYRPIAVGLISSFMLFPKTWERAPVSLFDPHMEGMVLPFSTLHRIEALPDYHYALLQAALNLDPKTQLYPHHAVPPMRILFIAGFGPVPRVLPPAKKLYSEDLGIEFKTYEGGYMHAQKIDGCKGFAIWPLELAAEDCFGTKTWPPGIPEPQAWLEFEVEDVKEATEELKGKGYRLLLDTYKEPYGQTVSRFLSPEGMIVGLVHTPWLREPGMSQP